MKNIMEERNLIVFFIKHTLAVNFVKKLFQCYICDLLFSSSHLNHMKNKHGGEKPHRISQTKHTCSSFCKEAVTM